MNSKSDDTEVSSSSVCLVADGPLIEFIDDVTAGPVAIKPEHIESMARYKFGGMTMIKTKLGFFLARKPDYFSLVTHWRELLNGKCSFTGQEVIRDT